MTSSESPPQRMVSDIERALFDAGLAARGHFCYESGHHGDLWLELDALLMDARRAQGWASSLAQQAAACQPEVVCGPLTGGAFVGQFVAAAIGAGFVFAERVAAEDGARYRIPDPLRMRLGGKRVLLVDDAVNAGSALRSTSSDLNRCGAKLVGFASLITLGDAAAKIAERYRVPFVQLASLERGMWLPEHCPHCAAGAPLVDRVPRS